jgi:hypothetical protein
MSIMLFSGRFDKPHAGHIITIQRLGIVYSKVIVVILDYPKQKYPIGMRYDVLKEALDNSVGKYEVITNKIHFGELTKKDLKKLPPFDIYGSGNIEVLQHIQSLGVKIKFVARYPGYSASKEKE